ncbi:MAG: protein kinase [Kofleriaceae bacterium]
MLASGKTVLGETIGNFKIVKKLGRGGMGEVWLGEQLSLGTRVAIKLLLEPFPPDSEDVLRFFNEARAVGKIHHAGITKIFDSGVLPNGRAYLVMEYLDGESLAHRIQRRQVSLPALADIGRQIASVLDATHSAGITHRDLKPENVFLIPDREQPRGERVKVLDFGVAKLTGTLAANSPRTFGTLGTPMYMAPEQWGDASQVDWRADLYSLGCVAFEMACGKPPFACRTVAEACAKHLNDLPPLASSLAPSVPRALDRLIAQLLAKDPGARPASMREVARAFEQIGQGLGHDQGTEATSETISRAALPSNADVLATVAAGQAAATEPVRRRGRLWLGAGALVIAGGAVAGALAIRGGDDPTRPAPPRPVVTAIAGDAAPGPDASDEVLQALVTAAHAYDAGVATATAATVHHPAPTTGAGPVASTIASTVASTIASIDQAALRAALAAHRAAFQQCNAHHDQAEHVRLTFTITSDGHATKLAATGGSDAVEGCAMNVVRSIGFPRPAGGSFAMVLPMTFDPQPDAVLIPAPALPERLTDDQVKVGLLAAEQALDACMAANHVDEEVILAITIAPTGRVSATDAQGHLAGSAFAACAFGAMRAIEFPAARTQLHVTVPVTPP